MPVATVYASVSDGFISSTDVVYLTARSGSYLVADAAGVTGNVGQTLKAGDYTCHETFYSFDLSAISPGAVVSAPSIVVYCLTDNSVTDFTLEARLRDWGATLTTADYVAGASLGALTLLASAAVSGTLWAGVYNVLAESGSALTTAITAALGTQLRVVLDSDRMVAATVPGGDEYVSLVTTEDASGSRDPYLTFTYTTPAPPFSTPRLRRALLRRSVSR